MLLTLENFSQPTSKFGTECASILWDSASESTINAKASTISTQTNSQGKINEAHLLHKQELCSDSIN